MFLDNTSVLNGFWYSPCSDLFMSNVRRYITVKDAWVWSLSNEINLAMFLKIHAQGQVVTREPGFEKCTRGPSNPLSEQIQ